MTLRAVLSILVVLSALALVVDRGADPSGGAESSADARRDTGGLTECGPMKRGDRRPACVRRLQRVLRLRGATIDVTGGYFDRTAEYVRTFQRQQGRPATGMLDQGTLDALADLPRDPGAWRLGRDCFTLRGPRATAGASTGACVDVLRTRLAAHGVPAGHGGTFDATAMTAVTTFQRLRGLPAVGFAGERTRHALDAADGPAGARTSCDGRGCRVVVGRTTTRTIAALIPDDGFARGQAVGVLSALICHEVTARIATVVCRAAGSVVINEAAVAIEAAARRDECLEVRVGPAPGEPVWSPRTAAPVSGRECGA
ncbi:peptidoglycan-binding domain-containing protein [Cryptosporangium japonicum]|uniref:Peptidoglycan binding-like domain-containing protein n=1 Tax=Cryptosporangium japonicum TaxID=80872 RepID=A0ABN0UCR1_9ACTN